MDQVKIGKFIAECRKDKQLTQVQLADKLGITDRAISKWENGRSLPDSGIMIDLCKELDINVNELLLGGKIKMSDYNENAEKNLLEIIKQKEESDKRLLRVEVIVGILNIIMFLSLVTIASLAEIQDSTRLLIIITSTIFVFLMCFVLLRIEQVAGYYECQKCHHKHIPTYKSVFWAAHIGRTRYMKCPECNKKSWQKKVISKE